MSEREALQETLIMLSGMGLFTDVGSKEDRDCDGMADHHPSFFPSFHQDSRTPCCRLLPSVENDIKKRYTAFPPPLERTADCPWNAYPIPTDEKISCSRF
ncbi:uncharacterized protein BT62DRAFT_1080418 [Guyanagaster necrorhizus]|uniref:Uncharacterized protein n=1 Tax=Guyanagaster necrorhizus TaxID=856835 RepID=A0A9P7VJA7_9AGAR|nr:uncharacterized protein BT62DRAFT_1080418 [Guyanagaster necrorhizus MCA 3950]KAG7441056.1 hypothetical protein BT62DRAFT_1080418 [Guyanagaster necrorhizus MCA 3950]